MCRELVDRILAHSIETGDDGLEMLMISPMNEPAVEAYLDEDMVGLCVGSPPDWDSEQRTLSGFQHRSSDRSHGV